MPEKHHYFPIFLQKRWAGADGRVCVYSQPRKDVEEVKALRRHPNRVGFENDLYTIPGVEFEAASHLERRFFLQTDNDASQVLASLEADPKAPLGTRLRSGWSRFVMSLIHRSPEEIAIFFGQVALHIEHAERDFEQNYHKLRLPNEPATFEEFKLKRPTNPAGRAAAMLIQKVIDSELVGNHLNRMIWSILSPPSSSPFLISDRPITMTNGLSRPDSHVALPIGPRTLFIASNQQTIVDDVARRNPDDLVTHVNDRIVRQARRFVIGIDDHQKSFISHRLFGPRLPSSPTETKRLPTPEELRSFATA
jgi:hypothetical protein